jgi:Zn-dependent peptidase ImmA (M78 family)
VQKENDDAIIARVVDAYRTAYAAKGHVPSSVAPLPSDPSAVRNLLAASVHGVEAAGVGGTGGNVRFLADRIQDVLGVDIVRDPGLQTDYSFRIGEHAVVLLKSTVNWFRANWSIAHELGHLVLGHHVADRTTTADEGPANAFAGEFLLPEGDIRTTDWQRMTVPDLALWLWDAGVSTAALRYRFSQLNISASDDVREAIQEPTPKLMRAHVELIRRQSQSQRDPIWERENATTGRQFPEHVVVALTERVEAGKADPHILAWVREVPVDDLYWPEPDLDASSADYAELSSRAEETDWFGVLDAR